MAGRPAKYDARQLAESAAEIALDHGLDELSYLRLARRLGMSDRMLVYYYPDKDALLEAVFAILSDAMMAALESAFGARPLPADRLLKRAWPVLRAPEQERAFKLGFQLFGRAAAGQEPHHRIAGAMMSRWQAWLTPLVDAPTPAQRRRQATAIITFVEGAFLMRAVVPDPDRWLRAVTGAELG